MLLKCSIVAVALGLAPLTVFAQADVFSLSCLGTETSVTNSGEPTVTEGIRKSFIIRGSDKMIAADVSRREAAFGYAPSGLCPTENVILWKLNSEFIRMNCRGETLVGGTRGDSFSFDRIGKSLDYTVEVFKASESATPVSKTTYIASCNERKF